MFISLEPMQTASAKILSSVVLLLSLNGCVATPPPVQEPLVNQLDGPMAQLQFDTKVMGIGSKACGGPEQFIVYSETVTDGKMLAITSERYAKLKKEQQSRLGMMSTCQQLATPLASCQAKKCVLIENQ